MGQTQPGKHMCARCNQIATYKVQHTFERKTMDKMIDDEECRQQYPQLYPKYMHSVSCGQQQKYTFIACVNCVDGNASLFEHFPDGFQDLNYK